MSVFNIFKKSKPAVKRKTPTPSSKVAEIKAVDEATPVVKTSGSIINPVSTLLHPYVSEKASHLEAVNQYTFKVTRTANKPEVKKAIQNKFNVTVVAINMINMPSKKRTVGRHVGTKSGFRKAIITLAKGESINFAKS